jgi:hypothetical protein
LNDVAHPRFNGVMCTYSWHLREGYRKDCTDTLIRPVGHLLPQAGEGNMIGR